MNVLMCVSQNVPFLVFSRLIRNNSTKLIHYLSYIYYYYYYYYY